MILGIIGGLASLALGIGSAITSYKQKKAEQQAYNQARQENKEIAEKNYQLQVDQFNYQKQLNQLQMDREDTAYSRAISDLQDNGINKLMALGNAASTGTYTSAAAPQFDYTATPEAVNPDPMSNVGTIMTDALGWTQQLMNIQQTQKQNELIEEEIMNQSYNRANINADTLLKNIQGAKTDEERLNIIKDTMLKQIEYLQDLHDYQINRNYGVRSNDQFKQEFNTIKAMLNQISNGIQNKDNGDLINDIIKALQNLGNTKNKKGSRTTPDGTDYNLPFYNFQTGNLQQ